GIDSIDSSKNKAHPALTITYLSLIDRMLYQNGIANIENIADKVKDRLDISYSLWKRLTKGEKRLRTMPVHTIVIYTTISEKKKKTKQNKNIKSTEHIKHIENNDATTNESSQSNINVSGAGYVMDIIISIYIHTIFPNLKTLVIYAYESERTTIEANIMEWFKVDEQKNKKKTPQIEEQKNKQALSQDNSSKKPPKKIELILQIQIYFVPDSIKADSPELLTAAYIYDDINIPNLEHLDYYKYSDGTFITTPPKEISTTTATAPVPTETK
ncbi:hypothetical protein NEOKW01_0607, partial [Nematocida sp. AWRm80]